MLVCDGCFSVPTARCYKIMDELRKELAGLRTEIRANSQTLEIQDYEAATVHCFGDSNSEE